jgi:hypothetical protein
VRASNDFETRRATYLTDWGRLLERGTDGGSDPVQGGNLTGEL